MSCRHPQKQRHPDKATAVAHIESLEHAGKGSPDMAVYPCRADDGTVHWHVGHDIRKFKSRIRRSIAAGRKANTIYSRRSR